MKKLLSQISIRLICVAALFSLTNNSITQVLWGMTSDGGSKIAGGNIFSINGDGTGFTERYAFLNDGDGAGHQKLVDYGDGYLYGASPDIIFRHHYDGSGYEVVYVFQNATGYFPASRLLKGMDAFLYGTTTAGGANNQGVIYKVKKNGTLYQVLHHFTYYDGDGPYGNLIQLNNGVIYGTTDQGGTNGYGTIYRINPDWNFVSGIAFIDYLNGGYPEGGLVPVTINSNTYLYGVTTHGGTNERGLIYRIKPDGSNYSERFSFSTNSGNGCRGPLLRIGDVLYGVNVDGGNNGGGVVYAYDPQADTYQKLHQFNSSGERDPTASLVNINGVLYGTTSFGGPLDKGVLYKLNHDGSGFQVVHYFDKNPSVGALVYANNEIYGLTSDYTMNTPPIFIGAIYKINVDGSSFQNIHSFDELNGYEPPGSLIRGQDGKLYGTTKYGGSNFSNGLIFSFEIHGSIYSPLRWLGDSNSDGHPSGSIIQATNGSFYGVINKGSYGDGRIFKYSINGQFSALQYFDQFSITMGGANDPVGSLLQASDGNLYGTTRNAVYGFIEGTVFRISTGGSGFTILKSFNGTNGANPAGSLIQASDGYLYGMTENGGLNGFGVIFKIRMDGTGFQKIFEFGENANAIYGAHPKGSLLLGIDGKLYGMAMGGGSLGAGTIFKINTNGKDFSVIYNFIRTNGAFPVGSLVEDVNTGFLFGMAEQGGVNNFGTIFKVKKDGTAFQKLLDFNGTNGKYPKGDLLIVVSGTPPPQPNPLSPAIEKDLSNNSLLIDVSPNPAKNSIVIRFQKQVLGKLNYTLSDIHGKKLLQQSFQQSENTSTKTIDISRMPPGTYILELTTSTQKFTRKIVKQ